MKCPKCSKNQLFKEGMICKGCSYRFLLSPKSHNGMTDGKFLAAVRRASQFETSYFTENQLYTAYVLNSKSGLIASLAVVIFLAGALTFCALALGGGVAWWLLLIPIFILLLFNHFGFFTGLNRSKFLKCLKLWTKNRTLKYLIKEPELYDPPPEWDEHDIYDYGVEKLLVVQRDVLVDLLVKNQFHVEHKTLIFAESGYPVYISRRIKDLLQARPDLPIFVVHDADSEGQQMMQRIKQAYWLPQEGRDSDRYRWIDFGLYPDDFKKMNRIRRVCKAMRTYQLPIDTLMINSLTMGLATSLLSEESLAELLAKPKSTVEMGFGSDFG